MLALLTAWQAWTVRSALKGARLDLAAVVRQLDADNPQAAATAAGRAGDAAGRADFHSHTPVWWIAQYLPLIGDDVGAVRSVSAAAHDLTDGVVVPMVDEGFRPRQFRPKNGRVSIPALRRAGAFLDDAAPRLGDTDAELSSVETSGLIAALKGPVEDMQGILAGAAQVAHAGAVASSVLPAMLGAREPRTYLVAFQNNAEVRATGGMPGTLGILTARDGRLRMDRTITPGQLAGGLLPEPVLPMTEEERLLFSDRMGRYAQDTNFTPDFPRFAEQIAAFWERGGRPPVDGVLSMDPVALSYLIDYTGPIELDDGTTLTRANTVEVMLRDAYEETDREAQDRFFDEASRTIFSRALAASGSPEAFINALRQGIDERRISVWSARGSEQRQLSGEDVANELPQDDGRAEIGVYFNDSAADKMSYYLRSEVKVTPESCSSAGVQKLVVDLTLRSTAPRSGLPDSAVGPGIPGQARGVMRNSVYLFAPAGGRIDDFDIVGQEPISNTTSLGSRPVSLTLVDLAPGERKQLRYVVYSGEDQESDIGVLSTPLADGTGGEAFVGSGCD